MPSINFFYEDVSVSIKHITKLKNWIKDAIVSEHKLLSNLNYIFCSDSFLRDINIQFLNHHSLTDIITFNSGSDDVMIDGEIFISVERVIENAKKYNVEFSDELHRVMIHGVLHLIGYDDKIRSEQSLMRKKENTYLSLRKF